jgi:hypothetical protein
MNPFNFNNISLDQLVVFSDIVSTSKLLTIENIKRKYLSHAKNFDETIHFLIGVGFISIRAERFSLNSKYKELLKGNNILKSNRTIKDYFLTSLVGRKNQYLNYTNNYLSLFKEMNKQFEFKPTLQQRLKFSGLRNLLMELDFICLDIKRNRYFISNDKHQLFINHQKRFKLSHKKFMKIMEDKETIGKLAELEIIQFEKKRLSSYPSLARKIEHVAISDVGAGYDILSYSITKDDIDKASLRYIEVKAVSQIDYKFFWTSNEIETAKDLKGEYYLYLIPVLGKSRFDLNGLRMIKAPYLNLYMKDDQWTKREELISCSLTNE